MSATVACEGVTKPNRMSTSLHLSFINLLKRVRLGLGLGLGLGLEKSFGRRSAENFDCRNVGENFNLHFAFFGFRGFWETPTQLSKRSSLSAPGERDVPDRRETPDFEPGVLTFLA